MDGGSKRVRWALNQLTRRKSRRLVLRHRQPTLLGYLCGLVHAREDEAHRREEPAEEGPRKDRAVFELRDAPLSIRVLLHSKGQRGAGPARRLGEPPAVV